MSRANNIFKNMLCLLIAFLVSFMELSFFDNNLDPIFIIIIFILTVPTIYLYFLPKHETMILFLYCIVLAYLLDFLGKDLNIYLFLITLFSIVILFTHSLYTANADRTKLKNPKYLNYFIILFIILLTVSFFSFLIYKYILKPNVNEQNKLALVYEENESREENDNKVQEEMDNGAGGGAGGSGSNKNIDWLNILKIILIVLLIMIIMYYLYKYLTYKLWLYKVLRLKNNNKVIAIYKYFLRALSMLGLQRKKGETPNEYLAIIKDIEFPFNEEKFKKLTDFFMKAKYSNINIDDDESIFVEEYFYEISKSIREKIGIKDYIIKYLLKI